MSDDLKQRLRAYAKDQGGWLNIDATCEQAADRIGSLEEGLDFWRGLHADAASRLIAAERQRDAALEALRVAREALEPVAECCAYINENEDDDEWAKFRLIIKNYRQARAAIARIDEALK